MRRGFVSLKNSIWSRIERRLEVEELREFSGRTGRPTLRPEKFKLSVRGEIISHQSLFILQSALYKLKISFRSLEDVHHLCSLGRGANLSQLKQIESELLASKRLLFTTAGQLRRESAQRIQQENHSGLVESHRNLVTSKLSHVLSPFTKNNLELAYMMVHWGQDNVDLLLKQVNELRKGEVPPSIQVVGVNIGIVLFFYRHFHKFLMMPVYLGRLGSLNQMGNKMIALLRQALPFATSFLLAAGLVYPVLVRFLDSNVGDDSSSLWMSFFGSSEDDSSAATEISSSESDSTFAISSFSEISSSDLFITEKRRDEAKEETDSMEMFLNEIVEDRTLPEVMAQLGLD